MKVFHIPCFLLCALLLFSLGNSVWLTRRCDNWAKELDAIDQSARQEDWDSARNQLNVLYEDWQRVQTWLHITIEHEELDMAQSLFHSSIVLCQEEDSVEFRAHLAELLSQLQLLDEMERISIKNIL